jgi:hypothetical protein
VNRSTSALTDAQPPMREDGAHGMSEHWPVFSMTPAEQFALRQFIRRGCDEAGASECSDAAALIAAELVASAGWHRSSALRLRVLAARGWVRVEVAPRGEPGSTEWQRPRRG